MAIKARVESKCPAGCGRKIYPGDVIVKSPSVGKYVHEDCAVGMTSAAAKKGTKKDTTHSVKPGAPNCMTCPSRMSAEEANSFFSTSVNFPMCARFGKVLGRHDLVPVQEEYIGSRIAEKCEGYGKPRPVEGPDFLQSLITTPRPDSMARGEQTTDDEAVRSCSGCKFYISPSAVQSSFGFTTGLCAATGRALLSGRLAKEADGCSYKRKGYPSHSTDGMNVMPIFVNAEEYDPDPVKAFLARGGHDVIDPQDYPTDREVTEDDVAFGIRAWRRIFNPDGSGRYGDLPIFDRNSFSEAEQRDIPRTGDDEHPEWYVDVNGYVYQLAISMMMLDETPALTGQPGVGKTELARHLAWLMNIPFIRISLNEESEVDDLIGYTTYNPEEGTAFRLGRVVKGWIRRCVLLLDEPNTAPDAVWQRIRPMTDNSKQLALDENDGAIYSRDPFCFPILAMNPSWDARNIGTKELAAADRDRLDHLYIDLPPAEVEKAIIRKRCVEGDEFEISESDLDKVMIVSARIRELVAQDFPLTWGIRPNIKVARKLRWFDPITAYKIAVTNDLEPETAKTILDVVRAQWS